MDFSEIIEILYSENLSDIIKIINRSVYVQDYVVDSDNPHMIYTGFSFYTQSDKQFDLLYDIETKSIIRQVRNEGVGFLQVIGIVIKRNEVNGYYNQFSTMVITESISNFQKVRYANIKDLYNYHNLDTISEIIVQDEDGEEEVYKSFIITNSVEDTKKGYPLQKRLKTRLFFDGEKFKEQI